MVMADAYGSPRKPSGQRSKLQERRSGAATIAGFGKIA